MFQEAQLEAGSLDRLNRLNVDDVDHLDRVTSNDRLDFQPKLTSVLLMSDETECVFEFANLCLVKHAKRLLKYLVRNELVFESVQHLSKPLLLLAFLQHGCIEGLSELGLASEVVFEALDVAKQLCAPLVSLEQLLMKQHPCRVLLLYLFNQVLLLQIKVPNPDLVIAHLLLDPMNLLILPSQFLPQYIFSLAMQLDLLCLVNTHCFVMSDFKLT